MIIYIKSDNEFGLYDMIHLNFDAIKTSWQTIEIPQDADEDGIEVDTLQLEIKTEDDDDKYDKRRKYDKLFDTLKLAVKLGVVT